MNPITLYESLKTVYFEGNTSNEQVEEMKKEIASLDVSGKGMIVISGGGVVVTYFILGIPYIGPLLGIITGVASLGGILLGKDACTASSNFQRYAKHHYQNLGKAYLDLGLRSMKGEKNSPESEQEFAKKVWGIAAENTFLLQILYREAMKTKNWT